MARFAFFSFHWDRDHWRAEQVRNSWRFGRVDRMPIFIDGADREKVKRQSDAAIERFIRDNLRGCSVTVVLIGNQTANRRWVNREIRLSILERKGLLGVRIHNMKDKNGFSDLRGENPFPKHGLRSVPVYDWVGDNGRDNLGDWIERAAKAAGR